MASGDVAQNGFPEALRVAISRSGRSLESLRRRLDERGTPVSIATLSYWQSGRSRPQRAASLRAILHLEELLGLPAGHLMHRIGPRRWPSVPTSERATSPVPTAHSGVESALAELQFGPVDNHFADGTTHGLPDARDNGGANAPSA
jgi:hypothetical protein